MDGRLAAKTIPTTMPVEAGYYSSNYGYRIDPITGRSSFHTGVDIIASPGTPVMAAAGGVVATVAYVSEYGNIVEVDHDNGLTSRYAHLSKSLVRVGQIASVGYDAGQTEIDREGLRQAVAVYQKALPEHHQDTAAARSLLGSCLAARGRPAEAGPLLLSGYQDLRGKLGPDHPRTLAAQRRLDAFRGTARATGS